MDISWRELENNSITSGPMEIITKFPGYITRDDNGKIDYDIHPDFWDVVSEWLEDDGFKPGDEIVVTISRTV